MGIDRRTFLHRLVISAVGLGLPPSWFTFQGNRYGQALAAGSRKLALLLGIDHYPGLGDRASLPGVLTDLHLQRELLRYRFGLAEGDIITCSAAQATPAYVKSLIQDRFVADRADVVVIHFSGYGQVLESAVSNGGGASTIVKIPGLVLMDSSPSNTSTFFALPTLTRLLASLSTPQITTILDCGFAYTDPALRGNLRLRSCPALSRDLATLAPEVLAALQYPQLQSDLWDPNTSQVLQDQQDSQDPQVHLDPQGREIDLDPIAMGVADLGRWLHPERGVMEASTSYGLAAEVNESGFWVGILTYLLTQYLWETLPPTKLSVIFKELSGRREWSLIPDPDPVCLSADPQLPDGNPYTPEAVTDRQQGIAAVIQDIRGNRAQVWLGGIPTEALCGLRIGTIFAPLAQAHPESGSGSPLGHPDLILRSRSGLVGQVQAAGDEALPPVGTSLSERIRVLAGNLRLTVGLDNSLERIERVDMTSAMAGIDWTEIVDPDDKRVDCILARMTPQLLQQLQPQLLYLGQSSPEINSYGLLWAGQGIITTSFGSTGEAAGSAVQRLLPRLRHLLAAKLIRSMLNPGSSGLGLSLALVQAHDPLGVEPRFYQQTARAIRPEWAESTDPTGSKSLTWERRAAVRLELSNTSDQILYAYLGLLDSSGYLSLLTPSPRIAPHPPLAILPQSRLILPADPATEAGAYAPPDLLTCKVAGPTELLVIASAHPAPATTEALARLTNEWNQNQLPLFLPEPILWVQGMLNDWTQPAMDAELRVLDHRQFAALSLTYHLA